MSEREHIEAEIRAALARETQAIPLSNRLFNQEDGLFGRLADTEEERRIVSRSPLFQQALRRLSELQTKEAAEFSAAVRTAQSAFPENAFLFKVEQPPHPSSPLTPDP